MEIIQKTPNIIDINLLNKPILESPDSVLELRKAGLSSPVTKIDDAIKSDLSDMSDIISNSSESIDNALPFIMSNTLEVSLQHLREDCIIPVFSRDNEKTIAHQEFIEVVLNAVQKVFPYHSITSPEIR